MGSAEGPETQHSLALDLEFLLWTEAQEKGRLRCPSCPSCHIWGFVSCLVSVLSLGTKD